MTPLKPPPGGPKKKHGAGEHILLVEDEQHLAIGITFNLEKEGYRVTAVADGPAALEVVEKAPGDIDLVVLDLMLPGMSGYAVCDTLRHTGHHMPVLMLTARTLSEDRTRGFEVGANQYMMKPFDLTEFLTRIRNLLHHAQRQQSRPQPASHAPDHYAFGQASVNFRTYEVTVAGKSYRLTQKEMKLLEYFVANEGRVIPREELLEEVWEMPGTINTRAPDQFIRRLRKMFEEDPAKPQHFLTIRDAGYRFVANPREA